MTEILTIKRKKDTKQAIGYTWVANFISLEELKKPILFNKRDKTHWIVYFKEIK